MTAPYYSPAILASGEPTPEDLAEMQRLFPEHYTPHIAEIETGSWADGPLGYGPPDELDSLPRYSQAALRAIWSDLFEFGSVSLHYDDETDRRLKIAEIRYFFIEHHDLIEGVNYKIEEATALFKSTGANWLLLIQLNRLPRWF